MAIGEGTFSLGVGGLPMSGFSRLLPSVLTASAPVWASPTVLSCHPDGAREARVAAEKAVPPADENAEGASSVLFVIG